MFSLNHRSVSTVWSLEPGRSAASKFLCEKIEKVMENCFVRLCSIEFGEIQLLDFSYIAPWAALGSPPRKGYLLCESEVLIVHKSWNSSSFAYSILTVKCIGSEVWF